MSGIYFVQPKKAHLRPDEVARFLNVSVRTVRNLIKRRKLASTIFPPGVHRIAVTELIRFLRKGLTGKPNWPVRLRIDVPLLRPEQAAKALGLSRPSMDRWTSEEKLASFNTSQGDRATRRIPVGALAPPAGEATNSGKTPPDPEEEL